jgi:hypothetical protein
MVVRLMMNGLGDRLDSEEVFAQMRIWRRVEKLVRGQGMIEFSVRTSHEGNNDEPTTTVYWAQKSDPNDLLAVWVGPFRYLVL